jgi:hypothetical protein
MKPFLMDQTLEIDVSWGDMDASRRKCVVTTLRARSILGVNNASAVFMLELYTSNCVKANKICDHWGIPSVYFITQEQATEMFSHREPKQLE